MKAIAKRIPERPVRGTKSEVAPAYGLTVEELSRTMYDYLQCEGCDDMGNEYTTLHAWLTKPHGEFVDRTPYQKGDDFLDEGF
jgi:hypothetical protein